MRSNRPGTAAFSAIMVHMAPADVRLAVDGDELFSLRDWLSQEDGLRGRVRLVDRPGAADEMGVATELVVMAGAAVPVVSVLARAVTTWLVQRRSDVTIRVTAPDGRQVSVNAKRIADPEKLIREVLDEGR
jgi:hypothetical protein